MCCFIGCYVEYIVRLSNFGDILLKVGISNIMIWYLCPENLSIQVHDIVISGFFTEHGKKCNYYIYCHHNLFIFTLMSLIYCQSIIVERFMSVNVFNSCCFLVINDILVVMGGQEYTLVSINIKMYLLDKINSKLHRDHSLYGKVLALAETSYHQFQGSELQSFQNKQYK